MNSLIFIIYTAVVTYVSLRPVDVVMTGQWDKAGHFALYFVFALLGRRVVTHAKQYLCLCLGIVIYGGLIEVAQSFTPNRTMSAYDCVANAVGVAVAVVVIRMTAIYRRP